MELDFKPLPQGGANLLNYREVVEELMAHSGSTARIAEDVSASDAAKIVRGLRAVPTGGAIVKTRTFKAEGLDSSDAPANHRDVYAWVMIGADEAPKTKPKAKKPEPADPDEFMEALLGDEDDGDDES